MKPEHIATFPVSSHDDTHCNLRGRWVGGTGIWDSDRKMNLSKIPPYTKSTPPIRNLHVLRPCGAKAHQTSYYVVRYQLLWLTSNMEDLEEKLAAYSKQLEQVKWPWLRGLVLVLNLLLREGECVCQTQVGLPSCFR